jgi:hypothetical protein
MSDYSELTKFIESTPTEDVKFNNVDSFVNTTDLFGIQQELLEDYQISLSTEQIKGYIIELGIDISFNDYRACDIIFEEIFSKNT